MDFARAWNEPLNPPLFEDRLLECSFAKAFGGWADKLCENVARNSTDVSIDVATLLLTRRYFEFYRTTPPAHRAIADDGDHTCIFQVFRESYDRLWEMHLVAAPPSFDPPRPPPAPPPPLLVEGLLVPPRAED